MSDEANPSGQLDATASEPVTPPPEGASTWRRRLLDRHRWLVFVLPLLVYMLSGQLEPNPPTSSSLPAASAKPAAATKPGAEVSDTGFGDGFAGPRYPLVYTARLALTLAAIAFVWPGYRQFAWRFSWLSVAIGAVGVLVWVGLAQVQRDYLALPATVTDWLGGKRVGFNPLEQFGGEPIVLAGFLAVRFLGLALVVPAIEEFFVRGFLTRFVADPEWWKLPIGTASVAAVVSVIVYAGLTHPGELLAAVVWFSLVTWLAARTNNIWDCVLAHAVTNLLLGVYVLLSGEWWLW